MQKIITLFERNYEGDRLVRNEIVTGAEWVAAGEGIPTRKYDGTCCLMREGKLYRRYEIKKGRTPPPGFEPSQEPDPVTGDVPGWVPVSDGPEDRWHREALTVLPPDGTYELCGPKVQGNPEGFEDHVLVRHGADVLENVPRTFEGLREYFLDHQIEGVVWHHPDGRMVKIKRRDFGLKRAKGVA
jgi:Family of unknown function (DUF5565)